MWQYLSTSAIHQTIKNKSASSGERGEEAHRSARVGGEEPRAEEERGWGEIFIHRHDNRVYNTIISLITRYFVIKQRNI